MSDIIQHTRDSWYNQITNYLEQYGFVSTDDVFENVTTQQQGGQVIIINGQRTEQPGQTITVRRVVYCNGDGWIMNEDDTGKREFTQVVFELYVDNELNNDVEICFYWDEPDVFNKLITQIF